MKCLLCENISLSHICFSCQELFLKPSLSKRKIAKNIEVFSFYKYQDIKDLLHTKHSDLGYYIYKVLADNSFKQFAQEFEFDTQLASIAVDDKPLEYGYSHTAILNQALKSRYINPHVNKLRAQNSVSYSGKSREFRMMHPRNFTCKTIKEESVILVDDIITTGSTLSQAIQTLHANKKEVLFCLTLADAKD